MFFRRKTAYKTIDEAAEKAILKLHHEHPEMGRKRLHAALAERGVVVDALELKAFLRSHKIGTPPPIRQAIPPWNERHAPTHPWTTHGP
jgi:hypothetical protein